MKIFITGLIMGLFLCGIAGSAYAQDANKLWKQEVSVGYDRKGGNTQSEQFAGTYDALRTTEASEFNAKASTLYSGKNKKMDGQKHNGLLRYAPILNETDWFLFGKLEAEHDKFAGINSRILPSLGAGYWFVKTDTKKASLDLGAGQEFIEYTDGSNNDSSVLIGRGYYEQNIFEKSTFSQELVLYPNIKEGDQYRIFSETKFTNPISEAMSLRVSLIDQFNSDPLGEKKKNDSQLLLSLVYSF